MYRGTPENNLGALWCWSGVGNSGQFFAAMQTDGNFCVYRGSVDHNQGGLWCWTGQSQGEGSYFLAMQDDGNLCVYRGSPGHNQGNALWCTMKTDPVVGFSPVSVDYDIEHAIIGTTTPDDIFTQTLNNGGSEPLVTILKDAKKVDDTMGWSDSLSIGMQVETTLKTGIPIFAEGEITLTASLDYTYTRNKSTTVTREWSFDVQITVPGNTNLRAIVLVGITDIEVPFTMTGSFILQSGTKVAGSYSGTFKGRNAHDLFVQTQTVNGMVLTDGQSKVIQASVK